MWNVKLIFALSVSKVNETSVRKQSVIENKKEKMAPEIFLIFSNVGNSGKS